MQSKNIVVVMITLLSFTGVYPASEPDQGYAGESLSELRKQLPKGWVTAQGLVMVVNTKSSDLSVFLQSNKGSLVPVGKPVLTEKVTYPETQPKGEPSAGVISPDSRFLYAIDRVFSDISIFSIANNGFLTKVGEVSTGGRKPSTITISPDGRFLFVSNYTSDNIAFFSINKNTGSLTPVGTINSGGQGPYGVTISNSGRTLFVSNNRLNGPAVFSDKLTMFSVSNNGAMTQIPIQVNAGGQGPLYSAISPDDRFLFVSDYTNNKITVFSFDEKTGSLTQTGAPVSSGGPQPYALTISPDGHFLFVSNNRTRSTDDSNSITVFSIDKKAGALTLVSGPINIKGQRGINGVTISKDGRYLFITNRYSNTITVYLINEDTGLLTQLGRPINTEGAKPVFVLFAPLPQRWQELQAIELSSALHEGQKLHHQDMKALPEVLEQEIAQIILGEDITFIGEVKLEKQVTEKGIPSLTFDQLLDYLFYHYDKNQVAGGGFKRFASRFVNVKRGTLTPEGFRVLEEWAEDKDLAELSAHLETVQKKLKEQNLAPHKKSALEVIRDHLFSYTKRKK